jgi:hypothetical protein
VWRPSGRLPLGSGLSAGSPRPSSPRERHGSARVGRLRRHGYDVPDLAELINARQGEIRSLLRGELEPVRSQEITAKLLAAGLPI